MAQLKNLFNKLDKDTLNDLIGEYYCYDGIVDFIGDDSINWRGAVDGYLSCDTYDRDLKLNDSFLLNHYENNFIEGTLHVECYSTHRKNYFCNVSFKPDNKEEFILTLNEEGQEEIERLTNKNGFIEIERNRKLNEKERDELFLFLFPNVDKRYDWLVYSRMETVSDPLEDKEVREEIFNRLQDSLIEEFKTEENAIEFIKENI